MSTERSLQPMPPWQASPGPDRMRAAKGTDLSSSAAKRRRSPHAEKRSHASGEGGDPGSYTVLKAGIVLLALPPFTKHLDIALEGAVKLFPLHGVLRS